MKKTIPNTATPTLAVPARLLLFLSLLLPAVGQAQSDYSGTWYITNGSNYYLCPALAYYQGNDDTPYLTTYTTGKDKNSIWRIEKVDDTYYRFIHNATGKYLTANDVVDASNPARLRLHLEDFTTPTDATLFIIQKHSSKSNVAIRSKNYDDAANDRYWFDIANGNKGNYWNGNFDGSLGFWRSLEQANDAAMWVLQEANPTCATPAISYSGTTFTISYPGDNTGVSIHYTTDGSEPTSSSATYSGAIAASGSVKLRAIAVKDGYTNSDEAMVYGAAYSATPHLLKTIDAANQSYYMIPPVDDADANADRNYLTTSNVPNPRMQWFIKPATAGSGIQYYYLVNAETGKYVYFRETDMNRGSAFLMKARNEVGAEAERFMFRIWEGDGYYNFSPKMFSYYLPTNNQNNFLCKQTSTDHTNPAGVYKDNTNGLPRWQMVDVPSDPRALSALPASLVPGGGNNVYFRLRNAAQTSGTDYFVYPPSSAAYATAAASGSNQEWYFIETADADTWNTYYNIRNAQTGDYLYFNGTTYNENKNMFLTGSDIVSGSEDKYKFLVLKTANTTYSGTWHIVPKTIRNNNNQVYIALNRDGAKLRTSQSRNSANSCWYLDEVDFKCDVPTFQYIAGEMSITCATEGAVIYYALSESEPAINDANRYTGPFALPDGTTAVTAIAVRNANAADKSEAVTFTMKILHSGNDITSMSGFYTLADDFTPSDTPIGTADEPFRGTIDGGLNTISGLSHPLFGYVENAVIRNVILDNVSIGSGNSEGNTGAIACSAKGATRIYNCGVLATGSTVGADEDGYTQIVTNSSTVSGTGYVGGLVGLLDDESRVVNCYSYANITGGSYVGGIVGYNNVATTSQNLKTMVMNCMFYGDITGGTNKAPIYNGKIITNVSTGKGANNKGVGNFNYFRAEASYVQTRDANQNPDIQTYNCALMAETRFLQRFDFFRNILNSNRELAAWWATGDAGDKAQMMKWVMEPSQIGSTTPYPILKTPGRYHSVVNIDNLNVSTGASDCIGSNLGTLTVTIRMGSGAPFSAPTGAAISKTSLTLAITDKDPDHFNFNYGKVQLPYYNDVATKNYTGNRVVTGWKIVGITGGTPGSFTTGEDAPAYNFADRHCTNKDLYGTGGSNRIFNQGAYWDVPEGVTAITIEPYWAKAAYLSDESYDVVYNAAMNSAFNVPNVGGGTRYTNGTSYSINGDNQAVYTTMDNAVTALATNTSHTPYDYAVVLVGNYHQYNSINGSNPYTVMSADFDGDNEPDYSFMLRFDGRTQFHPVRYDFLNLVGLGMAQKSTGGTGSYNFGIMQPIGWFEVTNTALFRVTQFEYDRSNRGEAPIIVQGGVMEQWVSGQQSGVSRKTTYFHVGGNVWFKEFHMGCHQDNDYFSKHVPISVTGGDYNIFYLTGAYKADVTVTDDNAECYINGGRFGTVAGTGMEGIGTTANKGNITWQIDNADIREFYGGGINAAKPATGNIKTTISNSRVDQFCGGPKFGDMGSGKTVSTTATGCTFGTFFGAGYGGNSYSQKAPKNKTGGLNIGWNSWVNEQYKQGWDDSFGGVSTQIDYQFLPLSGNTENVYRIFVDYVKFSLATCRNVTSNLTRCTVTGNFYGGGSLGKVVGAVNSTLDSCTVQRNVFGAGYSATLPTVNVMNTGGFQTEPHYDGNLGVFLPAVFPATVTYTWEHATTVNSTNTAIDKTNHILYTTEDLGTLGTVGDAILTLKGTTTVNGNVFGGGDQSCVIITGTSTGSCQVILRDEANVLGNVFGGGNRGAVSGTSSVKIQDEE